MRRKATAALVFFGAVILTVYIWRFLSPVREIERSSVYGAPQLSAERLRKVAAGLGIGTVVNLRGHGRGKTWYGEEIDVCAELKVSHHTVSFPVDDWPPRFQLLDLLSLLDEAERPLLLKCRRGVDRTGWASAVVDLTAGRSVATARGRLGWWHGHFCRRSRCPQHQFIDAYSKYVAGQKLVHSQEAFRKWANEVYCPPYHDAQIQAISDLAEVVMGGDELEIEVKVTNRGDAAWRMSRSTDSGIRLGVRVLGPFSRVIKDSVRRFQRLEGTPRDVARSGIEDGQIRPGETRRFRAGFTAPHDPGLYLVQIDMVDEGVRWFSDVGWPGLIRVLEVRPATEEVSADAVFTTAPPRAIKTD